MKNSLKELKDRNFLIDKVFLILLAFNFAYVRTWNSFALIVIFLGFAIYRHRDFRKNGIE